MFRTIVVLFSFLVLFLGGCAHSVKVGDSRVTVGSIEVVKSLNLIGETVKDSILIDADEKGNAIIYAGKGEIELTPIYLSPPAQNEVIDIINKSISWGKTALKEKVEIQEYIGHVSTSTGPLGGTSVLSFEFTSTQDGKDWYDRLQFCYIASKLLGSSQGFKSDPCDKSVTIFTNESSAQQFVNYLKQIPNYSDKAKVSQSKSQLFK